MTVDDLTRAYLAKAGIRFEALKFYLDREGYSDVVREAQEMVELLLKAVLRAAGVEVPKVHDVSRSLEANRDVLPVRIVSHLEEIKRISKRLRKERELSFYGAEDFVPTQEYDRADAEEAIREAGFVLDAVRKAFEGVS